MRIETQAEIWKELEGYKYNYEVSNKGRVRKGNLILTTRKHHRGHLRVTLHFSNGTSKQERVHRLVATVFISNPNNLPLVNHIDGNMENNCVENLEWCDASHNVREGNKLRNNNRAKSYPLKAINKETKEELFFNKMVDAERFVQSFRPDVKMPRTPIRDVCNGRLKSAYGYIWSYIKE